MCLPKKQILKQKLVNDLDLRTQVAKVEYHQSPIHDF